MFEINIVVDVVVDVVCCCCFSQSETMRQAEVAAYFGKFDESEKMFLDMDRRFVSVS